MPGCNQLTFNKERVGWLQERVSRTRLYARTYVTWYKLLFAAHCWLQIPFSYHVCLENLLEISKASSFFLSLYYVVVLVVGRYTMYYYYGSRLGKQWLQHLWAAFWKLPPSTSLNFVGPVIRLLGSLSSLTDISWLCKSISWRLPFPFLMRTGSTPTSSTHLESACL